MSKLLKVFGYLAISVLVIALLALLGIYMVGPQRYTRYIESELSERARDQGILLGIGGSELSGLGYVAHNISLSIPRSLLFFKIDQLAIQTTLKSVLALSPNIDIYSKLYEGELRGTLNFSMPQERGSGSFDLRDLDLSEHPQLAGLGIRSGTLNIQATNLAFNLGRLLEAQATLKISSLSKPEPTSWIYNFNSLKINLLIPAISDVNIDCQTQLSGNQGEVSKFELISSLGSADGQGKFELDQSGRLLTSVFDGTVELSDEGLLQFSSYLPLISNNTLEKDSRRFRVYTKSSGQIPTVRLSRL